LRGADGNVEFLARARRGPASIDARAVDAAVADAPAQRASDTA
jgi:hypothetical protein